MTDSPSVRLPSGEKISLHDENNVNSEFENSEKTAQTEKQIAPKFIGVAVTEPIQTSTTFDKGLLPEKIPIKSRDTTEISLSRLPVGVPSADSSKGRVDSTSRTKPKVLLKETHSAHTQESFKYLSSENSDQKLKREIMSVNSQRIEKRKGEHQKFKKRFDIQH